MMGKTCIGCGGTLQNTDPHRPFYTPKNLETEETVYCQRCYRMRHYGKVIPTTLEAEDYRSMVEKIDPDSLIVQVIDLFDIEGSLIPSLRPFARKDNLFIVANKRDLLPEAVKDSKLKHRLNRLLLDEGFRPIRLEMLSAFDARAVDRLVESIAAEAKGRDVYVVGATNVGKSTLINRMLDADGAGPITTFYAPGTTQDFIEIPFEGARLFDTPGLFNRNHYYNLLDAASLKAVRPTRTVKPRNYQLEVNQTLFLGALARLDFLKGLPSSFTIYVSEEVVVHRTKMLNADQYFDRHAFKDLTPPFEGEQTHEFHVDQFPLKDERKTDIVFPGLGFLTVKGMGVIRVYTPKGIRPYQREALI